MTYFVGKNRWGYTLPVYSWNLDIHLSRIWLEGEHEKLFRDALLISYRYDSVSNSIILRIL